MTSRNFYRLVFGLVLSGATLAQPLSVFAQSPVMAVARGGATGAVLGGPGTYEVRQYNQNQLESMLIKHFGNRQDQDREFVQKTVQEITASLREINDEINKSGGFVDLYTKVAAAGKPIPLTQYLGVSADLKKAVMNAQTKIGGILLIPSAIKSAEGVKIEGQTRTELPAQLKTDLSQIQSFFSSQLNAITKQLESFQFMVTMPNGAVQVVQGAFFMPQGLQVTAQQLDEMRLNAQREMQVGNELNSRIQDINLVTFENIRSAIKTFGTSQKYRLQVDAAGREMNLERLAEIFWARDYLRAVYGIQLGAIAVDYTKRELNWDFFSTDNRLQFVNQWITNEAQLNDYRNKLVEALNTQKKRSEAVFGAGVDMLSRVMSGITFIKGESQLASINTFILQLLFNDIEHERLVARMGGYKYMKAAYKQMYYGSDAVKKKTYEREDNYKNATTGSDDPDADLMVDASNGQTFAAAYRQAELALSSVVDKVEQAKAILKGVEALRANSGTAAQIDKRRNSLRD